MTPTYRLAHPVSTLRRSCGTLQVGLDAAASALLVAAPPGAEAALRTFRRWRGPAEAARLAGVDPQWLQDAVSGLVAAGVLVARSPQADRAVTVLGAGRVAHRLVGLLADAGIEEFRVADPGPGALEEARWRHAAGTSRLRLMDHWHAASAEPADLIVVAPPTVEPDRALTDHLRRAGLPHLVVRVEPERAVVGPFVVPGRSPCQRCLDLSRRDLDPDWPLLLAQLAGTWQEAGDLAAAWAASTAAAQVLAWVDRRGTPALGTTWELPQDTLSLETRAWGLHARCDCTQPACSPSTARTPAP